MKVILTEELIGLGEPGKIVDVAPGYARNYLVPRKLAVYANTGSARELEHNKKRLERKRQQLQLAASSVAERINGQMLVIEARVGKGGKLFGSVTSNDIVDALKAQFDVTIDRHKVHLHEPIRTLGIHEVDVRLMGDTRALVKVEVVDQEHAQPIEEVIVETPAEV